MPSLTSLPTELLVHVISFADVKSLKALRLTCRLISHHCGKELFKTCRLFDDDESCQSLESVMSHDKFKTYVKKLYVNTVEDDNDTDDEGEIDPPEKWKKPLSKLPELENLQSVALRFDKHCLVDGDFYDPPQTELYRAVVLRWLFKGLVNLSTPLKELAIQNLQNVSPSASGAGLDNIQKVLGNLKSLRLNVVSERESAAPEHEIEIKEVHEFFNKLPTTWLKPTMSSLENLSLYFDQYWGFCPKVDFSDIHFPHLKSLVLGNFSFIKDDQLDWILSHAPTLEELYFDDCTILFDLRTYDSDPELERRMAIPKSEMHWHTYPPHPQGWGRSPSLCYKYPKRWHDYFRAIQDGLPNLRRFAIGSSAAWRDGKLPFEDEKGIICALLQNRYHVFDMGLGPTQWLIRHDDEDDDGNGGDLSKGRPNCDNEDRDALKALLKKIGQKFETGEMDISGRKVEDLVQTGGFRPW